MPLDHSLDLEFICLQRTANIEHVFKLKFLNLFPKSRCGGEFFNLYKILLGEGRILNKITCNLQLQSQLEITIEEVEYLKTKHMVN